MAGSMLYKVSVTALPSETAAPAPGPDISPGRGRVSLQPYVPQSVDPARIRRRGSPDRSPMTEFEPETAPSAEPGLSIGILVWASEVATAVSAERVFEHCSVFVGDDDRAVLVLAALQWGSGDDTGMVVPGQWVVPFAGSVCGTVYRTGRPALIEDVTGRAAYRTYPGAVARSEIAVPISSGGRRIGVINLESARAGTYGIADIDQLTVHAEHAGAAFAAAGLADHLAGHARPDTTRERQP